MKGLLSENFSSEMEYVMRDPVLFGDYKNTLEESEPRLYEDIQDFDAAKALFQEVRSLDTCMCGGRGDYLIGSEIVIANVSQNCTPHSCLRVFW